MKITKKLLFFFVIFIWGVSKNQPKEKSFSCLVYLSVVDTANKPLSNVYFVNLNFDIQTIQFTEQISKEFDLPYDILPISNAIVETLTRYQDYINMQTWHFSYEKMFYLSLGPYNISDEHGKIKPSQIILGIAPDIGTFGLVFKHGYKPLVIFYSTPEIKNRNNESYTIKIMLEKDIKWAENAETKTYFSELVKYNKTKTDRNNKQVQEVTNITQYREELLKKIIVSVEKYGDRTDLAWAWLSYATRQQFYSDGKKFGWNNEGGYSDWEKGSFHTIQEKLFDLNPTNLLIKANYLQFKLINSLSIGIERKGPTRAYLNSVNAWTENDVEELIKFGKQIEEDPLLAFYKTDIWTGGLQNQTPFEIQEMYFKYRASLLGKILKKYPSVYWFRRYGDSAFTRDYYDNVERNRHQIYPIRHKDIILAKMKK